MYYLIFLQITVESWQLFFGFITLIVVIIGSTVAICKFFYNLKERIKVLEVKLEKQDGELNRLTNLFLDEGFNIFRERSNRNRS